MSSLLQQAGRAGRREQPSASIYVAFDGPTDQYFFRNPEQLFGRPVEKAQVPLAATLRLLCLRCPNESQDELGKFRMRRACVQLGAWHAARCCLRGLLHTPLPHAAHPGKW